MKKIKLGIALVFIISSSYLSAMNNLNNHHSTPLDILFFFDNAQKFEFTFLHKIISKPKISSLNRQITHIALDDTGNNIYLLYKEKKIYNNDEKIILQKTNLETKHSQYRCFKKSHIFSKYVTETYCNKFSLNDTSLEISFINGSVKTIIYCCPYTLKTKKEQDAHIIKKKGFQNNYLSFEKTIEETDSIENNICKRYLSCEKIIEIDNFDNNTYCSICQYCLHLQKGRKKTMFTFYPFKLNQGPLIGTVFGISPNQQLLAVERPMLNNTQLDYIIEIWKLPSHLFDYS